MTSSAVFYHGVIAVVLLLSNTEQCLAQNGCTIMTAPAPDNSTQVLNGDLQLLVPAWKFSSVGTVLLWQAFVQGNASNSAIEFQIFQPVSQQNGVYELVYGNAYDTSKGGSQSENNVTVMVERNLLPPEIPVREDYIVGIRLRNSTPVSDPSFGLKYSNTTTTGAGVDVYYWQGIDSQACSFSICDSNAGVLRGITPLVSWRFCTLGDLAALNIIFSLYLNSNPRVCTQSSPSSCPEPSTTSAASSTAIISSLSSSSTPGDPLATTQSPSVIPTTRITKSLSTITQSSQTTTDSIPDSILPTQSPFQSLPSLSSSTFISVVMQSSLAASLPTSTPTDPIPEPSFFSSLINVVALSVAGVLFLLVIMLVLIIICITVKKRTGGMKIGATPGIDNPDYHVSHIENGAKETLKMSALTTTVPISNGSVNHTNVEDTSVVSPVHHFDEAQSSRAQRPVENHSVTKLDTHTPQTPSSSVHLYSSQQEMKTGVIPPKPKAPTPPKDDDQDYDLPNSPVLDLNIPPTHYYSTPADGEKSALVPATHYYSSPPREVPDDDYDEAVPFVPSSTDPIVTHNYDEIRLRPNKDSINKDETEMIYKIVPTLEQRRSRAWRYEMSELEMQQGYDKLRFFEETNTFWAPAATTTGLYEQLAARKYREIPRHQLHIIKPIGEGNFGTVSRGAWLPPDGRHEVAVKMLKMGANDDDRLKLLQEAAIMGQFVHKNVVKLHGVVTVGEPVMMVLELMNRGDLRTYLRSIQKNHRDWKNPPQHLPNLLLRFCRDIACGMSHLSHKSFIHRDLAARNILLTSDLTCKIGDFGMARDLMADEGNYYTSSGGIIPLKWTAPEALNYKKYTTASDVWSYGMVLFEIWSLGCKPFSDLSNPIVIALINSKHCQPPPPGCPRAIYKMMVETWNPEHALRPPFDSIYAFLDSPDDVLLQWTQRDYNIAKYAHVLGAPLEEAGDLYSELQRIYQQQMLENSNRNNQRRMKTDRK